MVPRTRTAASRTAGLLMRALDKAKGTRATVRAAFVAVLGRPPVGAERSTWEREVSRGGKSSVQDLVWTLVNSHEFLFIQ